MKLLIQCEESGQLVTLNIDPSRVSLRSVRDLETVVSRELYGSSGPLKLRYVPTPHSAALGCGILHNEAFFLAIKQFILTVRGCTDTEVLVQFDSTISDVKNEIADRRWTACFYG